MIAFEGFENFLRGNSVNQGYKPTAHSVSPKRDAKNMIQRSTNFEIENIPPSQRETPKKLYQRNKNELK